VAICGGANLCMRWIYDEVITGGSKPSYHPNSFEGFALPCPQHTRSASLRAFLTEFSWCFEWGQTISKHHCNFFSNMESWCKSKLRVGGYAASWNWQAWGWGSGIPTIEIVGARLLWASHGIMEAYVIWASGDDSKKISRSYARSPRVHNQEKT
jgi:hypothetical protein